MNDNIVQFTGLTTLDIPAKTILQNLAKEEPKNVFVICWPKDGSMPTYHSSTGDTPVVLMRLQQFIHKFYNGDFD